MNNGEERAELLRRIERSAAPVAAVTSYSRHRGIYGFFLLSGCLRIGQREITPGSSVLLYLGKTESSQAARDAGEHLADGETGRSTLRRSLGALLLEQLNLKPCPRSDSEKSMRRFTNFKFDPLGEERLTAWMRKHMGVGFCPLPELTIAELKERERGLIASTVPPLNIQHNPGNPHRGELEMARKRCSCLALEWARNRQAGG
jgi:hypothetical protein